MENHKIHEQMIYFYQVLQKEIIEGNPFLSSQDMQSLRNHRPRLINPKPYPPEYIRYVYLSRRMPAINAILNDKNPIVIDGGCGYGSDSLMFAFFGARVTGVNYSEKELKIAEKRKEYYEKILMKDLPITFIKDDLDLFNPCVEKITLTWFSSVLAAIKDQDRLLKSVYEKTKPGGCIAVTDYNLLHPPFLFQEWFRRIKLTENIKNTTLDYFNMILRINRKGAKFIALDNGALFDNVQFFTPFTLKKLLRKTGFKKSFLSFHGFVPPFFTNKIYEKIESFISDFSVIRFSGRAYTILGIK